MKINLFFILLLFITFSCVQINENQTLDYKSFQERNDILSKIKGIKKENKIKEEQEAFIKSLDVSYAYIPNATKALRSNNPGNLFSFRNGKYRTFKTMKEGYLTLIKDLTGKINGKSAHTDSTTTVSQFIHIYSPPHENNTNKYVKYVCKSMGVKSTDKLHTITDVHRLAKVIIYMEDQNVFTSLYEKDKYFDTLMKDNNIIYLASK